MGKFDFPLYIYHLHSSTLHGWQDDYTQQFHSLGSWSSICSMEREREREVVVSSS
jgi:hypothetical protein